MQRLLQVGVGRATGCHGELLAGVFEGEDGGLCCGRMSLPMFTRRALATFWPRPEGSITVRPMRRVKAARAATLTLRHLGLGDFGGDLTIESAIPVGCGYGSSTADVVASIRAVAAAAGVRLRRSIISRLAVQTEGTSDSLAYGDRALLFACGEGRVIECFGDDFPPLIVVGVRNSGKRRDGAPRSTRPSYDSEEIELLRVARGLACRAIRTQDPFLLGRVSTLSASISQRHYPKRGFDTLMALAKENGACGVQVAHKGTAMGILLDAAADGVADRAARLASETRRAGFRNVTLFSLNAERFGSEFQ